MPDSQQHGPWPGNLPVPKPNNTNAYTTSRPTFPASISGTFPCSLLAACQLRFMPTMPHGSRVKETGLNTPAYKTVSNAHYAGLT